eukprot:2821440-Prymnesium_polylepis.1
MRSCGAREWEPEWKRAHRCACSDERGERDYGASQCARACGWLAGWRVRSAGRGGLYPPRARSRRGRGKPSRCARRPRRPRLRATAGGGLRVEGGGGEGQRGRGWLRVVRLLS